MGLEILVTFFLTHFLKYFTFSHSKSLHLFLAGKQSILTSYIHPIYIYQALLSINNQESYMNNIENWFLSSTTDPFNPTIKYTQHTAFEQANHPVMSLCLKPLHAVISLQRANLFIRQNLKPNYPYLPPLALNSILTPLMYCHDLLLNSWKEIIPHLFFVTTRITSQDIKNTQGKFYKILPHLNATHPVFIKTQSLKQCFTKTTANTPPPISRGQLHYIKYDTNITQLFTVIKSKCFRSQITSFLWQLLSRKL